MPKLTSRDPINTYNSLDELHVVRHNESYRIRADLLKGDTTNPSGDVGNFYNTGGVIHLENLDYRCWVNGFTINNVTYGDSLMRELTLNVGDATHPRKDVFAIDVSGASPNIVVVEGTPAATPLEPSLDLTTQVMLGLREVPAGATTDPTASHEVIYDENIEWVNNYAQSGSDLDYTVDSFKGSKNIKTVATTEDYFQWTKGSLETYATDESFIFALKNISFESNQNFRIQLKLINSSSSDYWLINLSVSELAKRGYISETVNNWQLVQIPLSEFQASSRSATQYDRLEFRFFNAPSFNIDWINVQSGVTTGGGTTTDLHEGYTDSGTRAGGNLIAAVGDYDDSNNGTKIEIDDSNTQVTINGFTDIIGDTLIEGVAIITDGGGGQINILPDNITDNNNFRFPPIANNSTAFLAIELKGYLVSNLPTGTVGDTAYVTDALTPTYLGTVVGGGAVTCKVFYNGSNWIT